MRQKKFTVVIICIEIFIVLCCFFTFFAQDISSLLYEKAEMTERTEGDRINIYTPSFDLEKGVYFVEVDYASGDDFAISEVFRIVQDGNSYEDNFVRSDAVKLVSYQGHVVYRLYADHACYDVQIRNSASAKGGLNVDFVLIRYIPLKSAFYYSLKLLIFLLVLDICLCMIIAVKTGSVNKITGKFTAENLILCGLVLFCCLPLTVPYVLDGHDLSFHMLRIAGLADGLVDGDFPVRLQGVWGNGYGAAVGVIYPDIFMYPFAALYALGLPLYMAYKLYIVAVNVAAVLIAHYSFSRMSDNKTIAMLAMILYSCSMWRLIDIFTRQALGEYTAMTFLPLAALGIYEIYCSDAGGNSLFLGLSGIVLSHPLSFLMTAEFVFLFCMIEFRETFSKRVFPLLLKQGILTFLLNAWVIVPLLDYYLFEGLGVSAANKNMQRNGMYFAQFFSLDYEMNSYSIEYSATREMPLTIGIGLMIVVLISISAIVLRKNLKRTFVIIAFLDVLALYMSTAYFPYAWFMEHLHGFYHVIEAIQFPWRYLTIATILSCVLALFLFGSIQSEKLFSERSRCNVIMWMVIAVTLFQSLSYISQYINQKGDKLSCLSESAIDSLVNSDLYLLAQVDQNEMRNGAILFSEEDKLKAEVLDRNGTRFMLYMKNDSSGNEYIDLPIMGYSEYVVNDDRISLSRGYNKRLRLNIPAGYNGAVNVRFNEPVLWRVCEIISLGTLLWVICRRRKRIKKDR